jgi:molybdopterin converting factor small subunit
VTINVRFFSRLKTVTRLEQTECVMPDGARVADLHQKLCTEFPALRDWDGHLLTAVGVEYVRLDHPLRDRDEVSVMPPVQGG